MPYQMKAGSLSHLPDVDDPILVDGAFMMDDEALNNYAGSKSTPWIGRRH